MRNSSFTKLDPSERNLIETAAEFAAEFDDLYLQGRDFVGLLRGEEEEIPSFRRFIQDCRAAVARIRDFTRAAEILIGECKLVGLMPAVLADHMRREADHFLLLLTLIEKTAYVPFNEDGDIEYAPLAETLAAADTLPDTCVAGAENTAGQIQQNGTQNPAAMPNVYQPMPREDDLGFIAPQTPPPPALPPEPPAEPPQAKLPADDLPEQGKFKWSGKWPRPLGKKDI